MNFAAAVVGGGGGGATPSLRDDTTAARYATNRQGIHLSKAKRCSDKAGHL